MRWFQRVFVIIPNSAGFCIVNEQLHITSATQEQIKAAFQGYFTIIYDILPQCLSQMLKFLFLFLSCVDPPESAPVVLPVPYHPDGSNDPVTDPAIQKQMIVSFADQSGMNTEWSLKCLEENGWNFERAAFVFSELQKSNQIPPEAFNK